MYRKTKRYPITLTLAHPSVGSLDSSVFLTIKASPDSQGLIVVDVWFRDQCLRITDGPRRGSALSQWAPWYPPAGLLLFSGYMKGKEDYEHLSWTLWEEAILCHPHADSLEPLPYIHLLNPTSETREWTVIIHPTTNRTTPTSASLSLQNPRNPWPQASFHPSHSACSFSRAPGYPFVFSCHFYAENQVPNLSPAHTVLQQISPLPPELLHVKVFQAPQTQCVQTLNLQPLSTLTPLEEALLTSVTKSIQAVISPLPLANFCLQSITKSYYSASSVSGICPCLLFPHCPHPCANYPIFYLNIATAS